MIGSLTVRSRNLLVAALLGLATLASVGAYADVRETRHNLIRSGDKSVDEKQVCTFCHTPVIELGKIPEGDARDLVPKWQRSLGTGFAYTIYDDIGRLGLGKASVGSQSVACLSCHDSAQAFEVGRTSAEHPFGVAYRGATKNNRAIGPALAADETRAPFRSAMHLLALDDFRDASQGTIEGRSIWWVSRNEASVRRSRGDLPLYGRASGGGEDGQGMVVPFIECSSCHDPHASSASFLRVSNAGSQLCLTCHTK